MMAYGMEWNGIKKMESIDKSIQLDGMKSIEILIIEEWNRMESE